MARRRGPPLTTQQGRFAQALKRRGLTAQPHARLLRFPEKTIEPGFANEGKRRGMFL